MMTPEPPRLLGRFVGRVRSAARRLNSASKTAARFAKVLFLRTVKATDYGRWTNTSNLETWLDARTERLARMIPPGTAVIEFGAGRRQLEKYLEAPAAYIPSDLVSRGPETLVCDLNKRPLPSLGGFVAQVAVFGGVLEYVADVPGLIDWLSPAAAYVVASYAARGEEEGIVAYAKSHAERLRNGYMNHYSSEELKKVFQVRGFRCVAEDHWNSEMLFLFKKSTDS